MGPGGSLISYMGGRRGGLSPPKNADLLLLCPPVALHGTVGAPAILPVALRGTEEERALCPSREGTQALELVKER